MFSVLADRPATSFTVGWTPREARAGATLFFDAVNEQGGVHGQKIELVSIGDRGDPERAARNVRALMGGWNALALRADGLRRTGPNPTREKLVAAPNGIARLDIGGVMIDYSATDHVGTTYSDMSVISVGRFQR